MKIKDLKGKLLAMYIKTLNINSKWFDSDIEIFKESLNQSKSKLHQRLSNMVCLDGGSTIFNKEIESITSELDKGGMYDMDNVSPAAE